MKPDEKNLLLDKLSVAHNRASYLKTVCEEQGLQEKAIQFDRRKARLKLEIDGLLRDLLQEWIGEAADLKSQLEQSNKNVEKAIKDIQKKVKTAQNITRALGYLDDIIKIAADLVP